MSQSDKNVIIPRILQFVPGFRSGGIESLLMEFYRCLDKRRLQFDFIVDTPDNLREFDEIRASGGRVFQMGRYLDAPVRYQRLINEILVSYSHEYIALHSHDAVRALPVLWAARRHGIRKRILHSHSSSMKGSGRALFAIIISTLSALVATDYWACSEVAGRFLFRRRQFKVIKNTIRSKRFIFNSKERIQVRDRLGINHETMVLGHSGRFTFLKNHRFLIRVFYELHRQMPDTHLVLVGEGPLEYECRELAAQLGITKAISFTGFQAEVSPFLSAMDIFLLPSHNEGFCISLLEAQANGLPCLVSSVVPDEVQITPSVSLCSLGESVATWNSNIIRLSRQGRADSNINTKLIRKAGYDTETQMTYLLDLYINTNSV